MLATGCACLGLAWLGWAPFCAGEIPAAVDARTLRVRHLTPAEGLSQSTVHAMLQDREGFVWLGTQDGLDRYDGVEFRHFRHDKRNPRSIANNHVWDLEQDVSGRLWVATDDGLSRYDPSSGTFLNFRHDPREPASLVSNRVKALAWDAQRAGLWVGTEKGLCQLEPNSGRADCAKPESTQPLPTEEVLSLWVDPDGTLWIGTRGGLHRLAPGPAPGTAPGTALGSAPGPKAAGARPAGAADAWALQSFAHRPDDPTSLAPGAVRAIYRDHAGILWLGTAAGLSQLDEAAGVFQSFFHDPADPESLGQAPIRALTEDRDGRLWIGTSQGLSLRHPDGRRFSRFLPDPTNANGLLSEKIFSLLSDDGGLLWIGTFSGGVQIWDPYSWDFGHLRTRPDGISLSSNSINAIAEDRKGNLWIGTAKGLNRFDRRQSQLEVFRHRADDPDSLADDEVMALTVDGEDRLWVGLLAGGLQRLDRAGRKFERIALPGEPRRAGVAFLHVAKNQDLWVGLFRGGLVRLRYPEYRAERHFLHQEGNPGSLASDLVNSLAETADGALWVGTDGGGISYLPAGGDTFLTLRNDPANPSSLTSDTVISIRVDTRGTLWVGTKGGGLDRLDHFDPATGRSHFTNFSDRDGLPSNTIYSILTDNRGHLWISTTNGLVDFDPTGPAFRVYRARHGLQNDEFNFGAFFRSPSGELFFGGHNGLNAFFPDKIRQNPYIPPIRITGILGRDRQPWEGLSPGQHFELAPNESVISFEFVALDYSAPDENRYAYRLEGFDDRWTELDEARPVTFTNLEAREYRFQIIGSSPAGVWNREGASVSFRVLPAWWRTWWALGLFGAGATALVAFGVRWRLQGLRQRSQALQALVGAKTAELSATVDRLKSSEQAALDAKMRALRALEEALDERRKAQEANRAKSVFLSNISHELRTPLNAVLGFAQLMEHDARLLDEHRSHLGVILRSGEHLLSLINDVLSFAKIEAGRLSLTEQPFELRRVVRDVEDMIRGRADAKGLKLEVELETPLPTVVGDEARLTQILLNLLGNAIKFTEVGSVVLQVAWNDGQARFAVRDTGVGIAADELGQLFEPFVQASGGRKQLEGTGLGLAISRRLVQLMGGELSVKSQVGEGSTFQFNIVLPPASAAASASSRRGRIVGLAPGQPPARLLIADDALENRDLLIRLLQPIGLEVKAVANGEEAVAQWSAWRPHLILLDIRMPVLDGYGAIRRIRQAEAEAQSRHTVIVALTASAFEHDRRRMLTSGFDDVLTKPFRSQALFDLLRQWLDLNFIYQDGSSSGEYQAFHAELPARAPAPPAPAPAPSLTRPPEAAKSAAGKKRILVAEDDPANQQVAQRALERLGLIVDVVSHGKEALDACQKERYDLVFMDVQMPVLDGIEATRAIRRLSGRGGTVPIVALTGLPTPEEKMHCLDAGMDDLLAKPFRLDDLRVMVERWLDRALKPALPKTAGPKPDDSGGHRPLEDSRELYVVEIRNLFLETAPFQLESLKMAAASYDLDRLAHLAMTLKSSSINLGANHLATACDRVVISCRREERPTGHEREVEEAVAELAETMQTTIADLRKKRRNKVMAI